MAENKKSVWSIIILVATIISLIILVASIVVLAVGLPATIAAARQAAIDQGTPQAEVDMVVSLAIGVVIFAFVLASLFSVFKIIGGFMFSLKGRWGIFCIVVSILSAVSGIYSLVTDITNKSSAATITISIIGLIIDVLLVVACFKHRAELQQQ